MKESDAILVTTFIRLKKQGYQPDRDLILALTADEEGGKSNGVDWLLKNHRDLIEAAFVLNSDSGGVDLEHGKAISFNVEATEKLYGDYQLTATNPGGHSSLPTPDNAIYHIADSLTRLQAYAFPFELNPVTRAYFARMSKLESGQTASDMARCRKRRKPTSTAGSFPAIRRKRFAGSSSRSSMIPRSPSAMSPTRGRRWTLRAIPRQFLPRRCSPK
jgi:acetylornithine deacetylase/succinyl-diaminopimelate desuccinylase-like protein